MNAGLNTPKFRREAEGRGEGPKGRGLAGSY